MSKCIHEVMCKYRKADPCDMVEVCKHIIDSLAIKVEHTRYHGPSIAVKIKKEASKHRGRPPQKHHFDSESNIDIVKAKAILEKRIKRGELDANQKAAFGRYRGVRVTALEQIHRKQIIDIYERSHPEY